MMSSVAVAVVVAKVVSKLKNEEKLTSSEGLSGSSLVLNAPTCSEMWNEKKIFQYYSDSPAMVDYYYGYDDDDDVVVGNSENGEENCVVDLKLPTRRAML